MSGQEMTGRERLDAFLAMIGRVLALCCHHEVGNLPSRQPCPSGDGSSARAG